MRVATFTLRIEGPDDGTLAADGFKHDTLATDELSTAIQHAEDTVNDRLPDGYYCKIDQGSEGVDMAAVARLEEMGR
jgi:hypothetical protein